MHSLASLVVLATLAVATPTRRTEPASQCATPPVQCCDKVANSSSIPILGPPGIPIIPVNTPIGITCSPINNNSFNDLVAINCVPVDLSQ
ncbi:fungal hydrophobin [Dendrothele bispora CBS 962.96]|uniref:Hydrophobin n=1 Tax=Dendrothele bispora (strain CBS 962.96) TaxID=1314807 RepID=A0A4S8LQ70_DENBC|nr:fungal hydrophobin [Dendrothele bispora CBS 962.96]